MILDALKAKAWMLATLASVGLLAVTAWHLHSAQSDLATATTALATERQQRAKEDNARLQVALDDAKAVFRKQEIHTTNQTELANVQAKQDRARAAAVTRLHADADSMRQQIAQYAAAGSGGEGQGDTAACLDLRDRAATLGNLLSEADGMAGEFAEAAELHADQVRTLKAVVTNDRALIAP